MIELETKLKESDNICKFSEMYKSFWGSIGRKRFSMPWRINSWEFVLKLNLMEIDNKLLNSDKDMEKKKGLCKQKKKLENKLQKVLEQAENYYIKPMKNKSIDVHRTNKDKTDNVLLDIKPKYAYCIDGTEKT